MADASRFSDALNDAPDARANPPDDRPAGKLRPRNILVCDRDWADAQLQGAIEGTRGRGDIVRKAVKLYLDRTREQRRLGPRGD